MKRLNVLFLDRASSTSLQSQLVHAIKQLIRSGDIRAGETLPSTRELAASLTISRNTVVYAYDRLVSEGYLESTERSGVFVAQAATALQASFRGSSVSSSKKRPLKLALNTGLAAPPLPFRPCQPDVNLFPLAIWNRLRGQTFRANATELLHYNSGSTLGLRELRENLATYLRESRGVQCQWWQIAVTSGSQQALFLLAQLLLKRGDTALMEDPGYVGAVRALQSAAAEIRYCPVDSEGVLFSEFDASVKLAYVTPSRQFPTGASLSLARRLAIVRGATERNVWVIEDDYDSEFRYRSPPLPSLQSLDTGHRVIYVGTFSKLLFPSLRLGYAVLPPTLVEPFAELKSTMEDHGPLIDQATLALFLDSGEFYSHIRRCRRHYGHRQETFLEEISKAPLPWDFHYKDGGMNLTAFLPPAFSDGDWARRLTAAGLDVPALSSYCRKQLTPGLVFGFTAFPRAKIRDCIVTVHKTLLQKG